MSNFDSLEGEAMAIGERSPLAIEDAIASGRIAIAEALTNILSSGVEELSKVKLSANWMASPNTEKNNFDLYHTVKSISEDLCNKWNITIPVGKDSLSMETAWDNKKNTSPQSLIVSAFSQIPDVTKSVTPDFVKDEELVVAKIDLSSSKHRLGGSILSETLKIDLGEVPDVEAVEEFPKIFNFFAKLLQERKINSYHDISDGGLVSCLIEMMISGNVGFKLKTEKTKKELSKFLFSEELGFIFQTSKKTFDEILSFMDEIKSKKMLEVIGHTIDQEHLEIVSKEFNESIDLKTLISNWTFVSTKMQTLRDNPVCALEEASVFVERETNQLVQKTTFKRSNTNISFPSNPKIAVIRDQGINGQVEMSAAFTKAGFKVLDVHMTDLKTDVVNLNEFVGMAFPGGFSYGDVLGAGRGWANSILMNSKLRDQFEIFFNRSETFSLGVCNGCQVLSELKEIIPGAEDWPSLKKNISNQFEARLVQLKVNDSVSIFFKNMENSQLIIPVAHGEGRMDFLDTSVLKKLISNDQIPLQYVNSKGQATEKYPANPNGSPEGISSICSKDGRATILMPHPERAFLNKQLSWTDGDDSDSSPWFEMFLNARKFVN
jgi:phosphoribosylformylglycinamidine synthase